MTENDTTDATPIDTPATDTAPYSDVAPAERASAANTIPTDTAPAAVPTGNPTLPPDARASLDISEPDNPLPPIRLAGLPPSMREACGRAGWKELMPVQSLALPYLMDGRDIMVQSRTGSGKTGCYLLPMLPRLKGDSREVQALVLVPTRELALQVEKEARTLFEGTGVAPIAIYGGVGYKKQNDGLRDGAQLVIGTPGRILDHILRHTLDLSTVRTLIFDEADRMLSIGFYPDMKEIQKYLPRRRIHTSLFSATYPPHVLNLASEFMTSPCMLSLSQKEVYVAEVQHCFCAVSTMDKDRALVRIIETENPASAIVFCNTKANVHYVCGVLQGFGYNADELSSDLSQAKREEVMGRVRSGQVRFLVATDVAARGIDIPALSHVFLYEPPEDHESYIHRAGRTGRAGAAGTVISLVDIMERMELDRIARHYHLALREIPDPSDDDVARVVSTRLLAMLEARFRSLTGLQKLRVRRYTAMARELAAIESDDAHEGSGVALLAMLLDACQQATLNENFLPSGRRAVARPEEGGADEGRSRRRRRKGRKDRDEEDGDARAARQACPDAETAEPADARDVPSGGVLDDAQDVVQDGNNPADAGQPRKRKRKRHRRRSGRSGDGTGGDSGSSPEGGETAGGAASEGEPN